MGRKLRNRPPRYFLVGPHLTGHHSPTGRGTKGYVALELPDKGLPNARLCFLKDYWRPVKPGLHTELETYDRLGKCQASYVATAIAGGGVVDAKHKEEFTLAQEMREGEEHCPLKRQHYRVVIREIGRPLETFEDFDSFVWYIYQALLGAPHLLLSIAVP
jgi:hypothetical protein